MRSISKGIGRYALKLFVKTVVLLHFADLSRREVFIYEKKEKREMGKDTFLFRVVGEKQECENCLYCGNDGVLRGGEYVFRI